MSELMLAYCGLDCATCEAYLATQSNNSAKLIELALQWYEKENDPELCRCEGCKAEGHKLPHCSECMIRACAIERELENCAYCKDYGCEKLTTFFEHAPNARANLEAIRQTL